LHGEPHMKSKVTRQGGVQKKTPKLHPAGLQEKKLPPPLFNEAWPQGADPQGGKSPGLVWGKGKENQSYRKLFATEKREESGAPGGKKGKKRPPG